MKACVKPVKVLGLLYPPLPNHVIKLETKKNMVGAAMAPFAMERGLSFLMKKPTMVNDPNSK